MVAEVLIEYSVKLLDKTFDYLVPSSLQGKIKVGHKVKVEFGNTHVEGFVLNLKNELNKDINYKNIICIVNDEFVLNDELLKLGKFIKQQTYSTLISVYSSMLPKALKPKNKYNINKKFITYVKLKNNENKKSIEEYITNNIKNTAEVKILNDILKNEKVLKKNYNYTTVNNLIKKNILIEEKEVINRLRLTNYEYKDIKLNTEQNYVFNTINSNLNYNVFLIHGVTGSGKTEIYIKLIKEVIKNNKTAIMLVPEISLTPQIVNRFIAEFKDVVALIHSRLSDGEKYDEYNKILNRQAKVVIGARSAIFAPVENLGIVIIDEEHSKSYKQENNPKYNVIEVAKKRCQYNNCNLVLGSATPSLETYSRALKGVYKLLKLNNRVNNYSFPLVHLVDMNVEVEKKNFILSEMLINKINERLLNNEQVILLLNRRGYNTFVSCDTCGFVYKCPNCDISLTFHKSSNNLRCHYCGYSKSFNSTCPMCKENSIKSIGIGTEKLEQIVKDKFKNAKVLRMDFDTTSSKNSHEKIINSFKNKEYDILLGTQMISKGLNFPYVTLVGILNSDVILNIPDFRSNERAFELYTQTSGRSGRSSNKGEVVIQTFNTDNKVLNFVKDNNYVVFFNYEMQIRKKLKYPPYYYLTNIKIISTEYKLASTHAIKVLNFLNNNLDENYIILGPTTCAMFKVNKKYHFSIIVKYKSDLLLKKVLNELNNMYKGRKVIIDIDNNPL